MTRETLEALKREHMGDGVCLSMSQVGQLLRIVEAAMELCECVKLVKLDDNAPDFLVSDAIAELREVIGGDDAVEP